MLNAREMIRWRYSREIAPLLLIRNARTQLGASSRAGTQLIRKLTIRPGLSQRARSGTLPTIHPRLIPLGVCDSREPRARFIPLHPTRRPRVCNFKRQFASRASRRSLRSRLRSRDDNCALNARGKKPRINYCTGLGNVVLRARG